MEVIYNKKSFTSDRDKTVAEILELASVKEDRLCIFVNGNYRPAMYETQLLSKHDIVFIYPELSGRTGLKIGASVVMLAATLASGGAFGAVSLPLRTAILIGGVAIATGLQALAAQSLATLNGKENAESPTYSLVASGNSIRPFEPMAIIFGEHNIFPDFSAQPYNEYKTYDSSYTYDSSAWEPATLFTESNVNMTLPLNINAPITGEFFTLLTYAGTPQPVVDTDFWYRYIGAANLFTTQLQAQQNPDPAIGDKYRRTYVLVNTCPSIPSLNGKWVSWEDFCANGSGALFIGPAATIPNGENFEFVAVAQNYPRKTEVVKQIMNFGFGDLVYLDDRIGTTQASDFRDYQDSQNTPAIALNETPTNWTIPQGEPNFSTVGSPVQFFNLVNGNVDTVEGGRMDRTDDFQGYVIRQGPDNTFAIQVDIEGRQFRLDKVNGGTAILTRYFDLQYRQVSPVVTAWVNFPDSMTLGNGYTSPYTIAHGSSGDIWRDTVFVDNLAAGQYEVRGRRRDPNETSQDNVSEIYLKRARFYQRDEAQNYVAQNRKAVIVESDSQLNGTLAKLASLISAKCWRNDGGGNFTWGTTSNPADWLLYYARGGFKNTSADGTLTYPYSPTIGWMNNADHPDNNEQIFGAGISDSRIDFDSITDWWNFCDSKNLQFAAVLDRTENVFETFKKICAVGRASPTWALGKLGVVFEDPNQLPVAMFTPENILKDSFSMTYITEDLPDEVIVNFMNPDDNWQQDSVRAQAIGVLNPVNTVTVDMWGVISQTQAQREANLLIARQTYQRRVCSFSVDGEGLIVTRGDVILVSYELFNWDYSSRILSTENDGVNLTKITLDCEIDDTVTHVSIRLPNGDLASYAASIFANVITLLDPFPLSNAPYYLDQMQTVNLLSIFDQSVPEDYLIIAGDRPTPGRTMRIMAVNPKGPNEFEIECTEEDPGFYAQEFSLSGLPLPIEYERVKASVLTAGVIVKGNGKATLYWTLDGATAVSIMLSLNGAMPFLYTIGGATHFGDDVELSYSSGDVIVATITPIYVDTPFAVVPQTVTFTMT